MPKASRFTAIISKLNAGGYSSFINYKRGIGMAKLSTKQYNTALERGEEYFANPAIEHPAIKPQSNGAALPDSYSIYSSPAAPTAELIQLYSQLKKTAQQHKIPFQAIIHQLLQIETIERFVRKSPDMAIDEPPTIA